MYCKQTGVLVKDTNIKMQLFVEEAKKTIPQTAMRDQKVHYVPYIEPALMEIRYLTFVIKDGNWNFKEENKGE